MPENYGVGPTLANVSVEQLKLKYFPVKYEDWEARRINGGLVGRTDQGTIAPECCVGGALLLALHPQVESWMSKHPQDQIPDQEILFPLSSTLAAYLVKVNPALEDVVNDPESFRIDSVHIADHSDHVAVEEPFNEDCCLCRELLPMVLAKAVTDANDGGRFDEAWTRLAEALAFRPSRPFTKWTEIVARTNRV